MTTESDAAPLTDLDEQVANEALELLACQQSSETRDEGDEPSLDEYFKSFMQRIGISEQRVSEAAPTAQAAEPVSKQAVSAPQVATKPQRAESSAAAEPRRPAPQESTSRAAMRELAVSSARHAIGSSDAKLVASTWHHLIVAGGAVALALVLLGLSPQATSYLYLGAVIALGTSLYYGLRFLRGACLIGTFGPTGQQA